MSASSSNEVTINGVTIRRLRPDEAAGVTRLVQLIYEDTYYPRDLYDPEKIVRLNQAGRLVSVVAVDPAGEVVGHYALERPHQAVVAEASDAIVRPDHRHQHILEQMRVLLREEAIREGLAGLVGYAVTNHLFTQKAEEHFGAHPCGIALGLWPRTFHNMAEPLTQRMSFAMYFKFLRPVGPVVHVATHHQDMIARIYQQYGVAVELIPDAPAAGAGVITLEHEPILETGLIQVRRIGADTVSAVQRTYQGLCDAGAKTISLELPLCQAGVAALCRSAEDVGFFFSGIGPAFAGDGDALLLQLPREEVDSSLVQIDELFARELLTYVDAERTRIGRRSTS